MKKDLPFQLQDGEKIIEDIKPLSVLKWYFFLSSFILVFLIVGWLIFLPFLVLFMFPIMIGALLFFALIMYLIADNRYKHQYYWITNKRILARRGILGYKINSIPLERVSDVMVSRTFLENLFGFGSIHVQSLAGQMTYGSRTGAEGALIAVPDPEGSQKLIFELIKKKRKSEKLTM